MLKVREGRYGLQPVHKTPQNHLAFRPWGTLVISFQQKLFIFPQPVKAVPSKKEFLHSLFAAAKRLLICRKSSDQLFSVSSQIDRPARQNQWYQRLAGFQDLSNCDLRVCRYFFQGIFLLGKRP